MKPESAHIPTVAHSLIARTLPWVVVAAITYASLFPFQLSPTRLVERLEGDWLVKMLVARSSPVDTVANLFFYMPLGFVVFLRRQSPNTRRLILAVSWCAALSAAMEILQHATPSRTPSALDFTLNVVSGAVGALVAMTSSRIRARVTSSIWLRADRLNPIEITLALCWLCLHAAPFIPRMGVYRTLASLDEVLAWDWTFSGAALWGCRHLLMATSLRLLVVRERFWQVYMIGVAASLLAQIVFIQHKLLPDEIIGATFSLTFVALTRGNPTARILLPTCLLALFAYALSALAPFDFSTNPQAFRWLPFTGVLESGVQFGFFSMLGKLFVFLGLLWLLMRGRLGLMAATFSLVSISLLLEVIQIYLPGRAPEMTDPVLVLVPALLLWLVNRQQKDLASGVTAVPGNPKGRVRPE